MSLFGSLMGDHDDDPIFGSYMQSMRNMNDMMMNSMFNDPFGIMGYPRQNAITDGNHRSRARQNEMQLMPFGFPPMPMFNMGNMGNMLQDFDNMASGGNCHSYVSRSVMTRGTDGRPQVYQETMSTTHAPGGVKETKKTVSDSRTGLKKMAIGHHIGERAHILEREHNFHSGEQEEHQEFINLEEEEAESFNNEWETLTRHKVGHRTRPEHKPLALTDASGSRYSSSSKRTHSSRRNLRLPHTSKTNNPSHSTSSDTSGHVEPAKSTPKTTTGATGNRKRKHVPDDKDSKKCHVESDSNV